MNIKKIEILQGVPPALPAILSEFVPGRDWPSVRKRIRSKIQRLRESSYSFAFLNKTGPSRDHLALEIHLHGALDLLGNLVCSSPECRLAASERMARSLGLIADRIWLTDYMSDQVVNMGRPTNKALDKLMSDTLALIPLLPLIEAGIVRFQSNLASMCDACNNDFENQVSNLTKEVLANFRRDFRIKSIEEGGHSLATGRCFEPPVFFYRPEDPKRPSPSVRKYAIDLVEDQIRTALWTARDASLTGGAVFTNSRVGLAGLLSKENRLPLLRHFPLFDQERELSIPWVSDLSTMQILELREEASQALPLFREKLARSLTTSGEVTAASNQKIQELISDLREQAAEVRAELLAKQKTSSRYWKTTYGLMSLGISAFGLASDQIAISVGGLLPLIQLLINHKSGYEADVEKLKLRPGYVLVKAQDLLAHAH